MPTDLEQFLNQPGRDEAVREVRRKIDEAGVDYVYYQFVSVTGRIMGKAAPADQWERMSEKGFLEKTGMTARDLVALRVSGELFAVEASRPVEDAIQVMSEHDFSQISVTRDGRVVGSLNEAHLYAEFVRNPDIKRRPVESIMQPAFPFVDASTPVDLLATVRSGG